jgi:hypothetical protein
MVHGLALGHENPVSEHEVLERTDRGQLAITRLALSEERHVQPWFHDRKPTVGLGEVR